MSLVNAETGEKYEVHPVADLFPMLPDDELADLAADIAERGQLQPIVLDAEGRILDGRNRFAACQIAGVEPVFSTYDGDDPDGYALAVNLSRRHMTKGQQAMVAARAVLLSNTSQKAAAEAAGLNRTRVVQASTVLDFAPDLADAVVAGSTPLNEAYREATDRKKAAHDTEAQMLRLRVDAPDLADLVAEERLTLSDALATLRQREEDRKGSIRRDQAGLRELVNGWIRLVSLPDHAWRDEVLEGLIEEDRKKVLEIEAIYLKGTKR